MPLGVGAGAVTLYFAYGSNLNVAQMAYRCPAARPVERFTARNHRLVFRDKADMVHAPGFVLPGALYRITPACEAALDRFEGYPHKYAKIVFRLRADGRDHYAIAYRYRAQPRPCAPSDEYVGRIARGYADWNIHPATLDEALDYCGWPTPEIDHDQRIPF